MIRYFFILLTTLLYADAQALTINDKNMPFKNIVVDYYQDSNNTLTVESLHHNLQKMSPLQTPLSLGYNLGTTKWLHLKVINSLWERQELKLFIRDGYVIDELYYYDIRKNSVVAKHESGRFSARLDKGLYSFALDANETADIYMQIKGMSPAIIYMTLSDESYYKKSELLLIIENVIYLGILLALFLFNLFLYFGFRQKEYLYYILYIFTTILWVLSIAGVLDRVFEIRDTHLGVYIVPFTLTFLLLFTKTVLELKERMPKINRLTNIYIGLALAWVGLSLVVGIAITSPLISLLSLVISISLIFMGIAAVRAKVPAAKFYLLATGGYMIMLILAILLLFGIVPYNFFMRSGLTLGPVVEGILLSILLSYRYKLMRMESKNTQKLLHEEIKSREEVLQQKINEQTLELRANIAELEKISNTDALTCVPNRRAFLEEADILIQNQTEDDLSLYLMILDIDHFKKVNDTFGHDAGDEILIFISEVIEKSLLEKHIFGRLGGEEFGVIITKANIEDAKKSAEIIREAVKEHTYDYQGNKIDITLSIGIAVYKNESIKEWIKESDKALYTAKENGRDCVEYR